MDNQNYDFIMNSANNQPSGPAMLQDPKKRLMIAVLFVAAILVLVLVVVAIILNLGKGNSAGMKDVVAYQTEIVRVAGLGSKDAKDPATKAKLATIQSFVASDLAQTKAYVEKSGSKISKEELARFQDSKTDAALESAKLANNFDSVVVKKIEELLEKYQVELASVFEGSSKDEEKKLLDTSNKNVVVFVKS